MRILVLGTGGMAKNHVAAFQAIPGVSVVAGVDTRPDLLAAFCDRHGIAERFTSLDAALAWGGFDAVTNVTPDAVHHATTMPVLAAGKHILCEKPLATDYPHAAEMAAAAARAGVVNMVNLSYRNVPALQAAARMVAEGVLGAVRHFEASYLQSWLTQPAWGDWATESQWLWRLSTAHGSKGVLGDVGIHILDYATFIAGSDPAELSARLATFDKAPGGRIGDYALDANDSVTMHLRLRNGALGTVSATRFASGHLNDLRLRIYGDRGGLEVLFEKGASRLNACLAPDLQTATWAEVKTDPVPTVYERFVAAIRGQGAAEPDFARGAALQLMLDRAEESARADCRTLPVSPAG
ncbi:MAG: gfo/Idh/MocA family oxidoreductase [Rhodobacteraceae bacterium]|nr:gfo/Idh/MocA family oxidoreductase [Paracoccaceae bacterium]